MIDENATVPGPVGPGSPTRARGGAWVADVLMGEVSGAEAEHALVLRVVQPALAGLMDGSVSTLAPFFAVAFATQSPHTTFVVGMAAAVGAGISMGFSEGLSDSGELTGRGHPFRRGAITGGATFLGGVLHTLPFLIPHYRAAIILAIIVVGFELVVLAWMRWRYFEVGFLRALATVTLGGIIIAAVSAALGNAA